MATIAEPVVSPELDVERLEVELSVHAGCIVTSPETFVAHPRSVVTWSAGRPFLIRFDHDTPVWGGREVEAKRVDDVYVARAAIRDDATRSKPFKYTIAMCHEVGGEHRVVMSDPDGVVEPDPRRSVI